MTRALPWLAGAALIGLPFVYNSPYPLHILVIILIWSFAYTSWSVMGRFGLTSLGHGGFMGVGAYVTALAVEQGGPQPLARHPAGAGGRRRAGRGGGLSRAFASASPATTSRWSRWR